MVNSSLSTAHFNVNQFSLSQQNNEDNQISARFLLHSNLRLFTKALVSLGKLGDELFLEPSQQGVRYFDIKELDKGRITLFDNADIDNCSCIDVSRIFDISMLETNTAYRTTVDKNKLMNTAVTPAEVFMPLINQIRSDNQELIITAMGSSFVLKNFSTKYDEFYVCLFNELYYIYSILM
uniref:Uncharacterized protein n=1 Tax=Heterorhabditis bacteriophora TaxID=37862 RepID=A0A1I7WUW2_HETBA